MNQIAERLLLDTHALIWFIEGDKLLSKEARDSIENEGSSVYVSIVSLWEIVVKVSLGKLKLKQDFSLLKLLIEQNGFQLLPVAFDHLLQLKDLAFHHRDPFDRLIIAQGKVEPMTIITKDAVFRKYGVLTKW